MLYKCAKCGQFKRVEETPFVEVLTRFHDGRAITEPICRDCLPEKK